MTTMSAANLSYAWPKSTLIMSSDAVSTINPGLVSLLQKWRQLESTFQNHLIILTPAESLKCSRPHLSLEPSTHPQEPPFITSTSAYLQWCIRHEDAKIGVFHAVDDFVCLSTAQTHTYGNFQQTQQIPDLPLRAKVADMILDDAVGEVLLDDFSVHEYHIKRMI